MMGELPKGQNALFYDFCLEKHIPQDHLLRQIDHVLDLGGLRDHLSGFYSKLGRPSIDPELMVRMLILGYCFGIRSERRLCEEVHLNLAYRWFCRLGLSGVVPDHSTFSKNRHGRFRESNAFRVLFEQVVQRCITHGLVGGEGFAIDASVVKADANRQRSVSGNESHERLRDVAATRPVREYLAALEQSNPVDAPPRNVSLTDPSARWTAAPGGPAFYAYSNNYLVDVQAGIIVDVAATPAYRPQEVDATKTMVERVEERFSLTPTRLIGDTAYGTASMLGWMVNEKGLQPHVPVWDKSEGKAELFGRSDFTWEAEADRYVCPACKSLQRYRRNFTKPRTGITKDNTIIYSASQFDCEPCPMKHRCCPKETARRIRRSLHEDARDLARALATTAAYARSRKDRKKVEMLFAHLKRILKLDRLRLRGLSGANDEFLLAATAQNLRRMVKLLSKPPPCNGVSAPA